MRRSLGDNQVGTALHTPADFVVWATVAWPHRAAVENMSGLSRPKSPSAANTDAPLLMFLSWKTWGIEQNGSDA